MKKLQITILVALALATLILSGCGHSVSSTFTGKSINLGYNPNTGEVGIQYKDGTIIASATKENTTSNVEIDNSTTTDAEGNVSTSGVTKFSHATGSQINGYFVDALEAGATVEELTGVSPETSEQSDTSVATTESTEADTAEVAAE